MKTKIWSTSSKPNDRSMLRSLSGLRFNKLPSCRESEICSAVRWWDDATWHGSKAHKDWMNWREVSILQQRLSTGINLEITSSSLESSVLMQEEKSSSKRNAIGLRLRGIKWRDVTFGNHGLCLSVLSKWARNSLIEPKRVLTETRSSMLWLDGNRRWQRSLRISTS